MKVAKRGGERKREVEINYPRMHIRLYVYILIIKSRYSEISINKKLMSGLLDRRKA